MIFLNQYYEDEAHEKSSGWTKNKTNKPTQEIASSAVQDECFLFRATENGDLVGIEEGDSTHQSEYDDECNIFESNTFQNLMNYFQFDLANLVQKSKKPTSKHSSTSFVDNHHADYKKSVRQLGNRTEHAGIFDRKARSRDISANHDKKSSNRPGKVPIKDYLIDLPKSSSNLQDHSEDFESDANQKDHFDVDLSGDSDLYTEVQNYMKGHKHAGGLRAKDQTDEEHSKCRSKGGIFNTHSYDRASSKQSLLNAKAELDRLKTFSKAPISAVHDPSKIAKDRQIPNMPPARENSKEPIRVGVAQPKLSIATNVFSVIIAPRILEKQQLTLPTDCPHCKRTIMPADASKSGTGNCRTGSKESLNMRAHPSPQIGNRPRASTPKPYGVVSAVHRPDPQQLDRSLLNKTIMRTDTSKENHVTDRRKSAWDPRSRERPGLQPTGPTPKSGGGPQRSVLLDRERNRGVMDEFSKSPIMRTLNDSKGSRGTCENRNSWSRVERPLHKSKETLGLTPELSRPKKPAATGLHAKTGTPGLVSKKQNMKFR